MDLGCLLQSLGSGIDTPLVIEVIARDEDGCVTSVKHVPVERVSMIWGDGTLARIIIDKGALDDAIEYPNHDTMRLVCNMQCNPPRAAHGAK